MLSRLHTLVTIHKSPKRRLPLAPSPVTAWYMRDSDERVRDRFRSLVSSIERRWEDRYGAFQSPHVPFPETNHSANMRNSVHKLANRSR
jgi:hypothetical protein